MFGPSVQPPARKYTRNPTECGEFPSSATRLKLKGNSKFHRLAGSILSSNSTAAARPTAATPRATLSGGWRDGTSGVQAEDANGRDTRRQPPPGSARPARRVGALPAPVTIPPRTAGNDPCLGRVGIGEYRPRDHPRRGPDGRAAASLLRPGGGRLIAINRGGFVPGSAAITRPPFRIIRRLPTVDSGRNVTRGSRHEKVT